MPESSPEAREPPESLENGSWASPRIDARLREPLIVGACGGERVLGLRIRPAGDRLGGGVGGFGQTHLGLVLQGQRVADHAGGEDEQDDGDDAQRPHTAAELAVALLQVGDVDRVLERYRRVIGGLRPLIPHRPPFGCAAIPRRLVIRFLKVGDVCDVR